jgi:TPR repeat protein|nr:tetratricopeptide repeat protein [Kiritimatiellia bacterium]
MMYLRGEGVVRNYDMAVDWFRKSAKGGCLDATYNMAMMYEYGRGVAQNHIKAANLCRDAARRGHVGATEWLVRNGYSHWAVEKSE